MKLLRGRSAFLGTASLLFCTIGCTADRAAQPVALRVLEPAEREEVVRDWPVSVGLVFPEGELETVPGGNLYDDRGLAVPFEAEATGWWNPEKTHVKWLLLRFRANADRAYSFVPGATPDPLTGRPLAHAVPGAIEIDTGPLFARIDSTQAGLFSEIRLNGQGLLLPLEEPHLLVADDGTGQATARLSEWSAVIEETTPLRAEIKALGTFLLPDGSPLAQLDLRYQFFRGESFVRVYHTLTWLVHDPAAGLREYALEIRPALGTGGTVRIGESEYSDTHVTAAWRPGARVRAEQVDPENFRILDDGRVVREGRRLGGWIALEREDGRGVGIALREAWQKFPTALAARDDSLRVEFWPSGGPRMGFLPEDIMPPDFYYNADYWNRFRWVGNRGHFMREEGEHTPEGTARTHELAFHFYDSSSRRTTAGLNSLTQHPFVVQQDPESAMRVPFLGLDIEPVNPDYPDMERALEQLGRLALGRWAQNHDYGLWRYGMIRWGTLGPNYRWFDGVQYGTQIVPWLLYIRGGGRHWYEEAEATARYAMDVATNHFNLRHERSGSPLQTPAGYQASASGMPFPAGPYPSGFLNKVPKINFLSYYYHLTGYRRAREVMDRVIEGNKRFALMRVGQAHRASGREVYNMNSFWVNAWEETFDPEIRELAREWLDRTLKDQYDAESNTFNGPLVYLYPGLILQHGLFREGETGEIMLRYLARNGFPGLEHGGVRSAADAVACGWALSETGDGRFAKVGWDIARTLADLVPDHDWSSPEVPGYPITGHNFWRSYLQPIIVGYSLGIRHGFRQNDAFVLRDTFIGLAGAGQGRARGEIFLRPKTDGDLGARLLFVGGFGRQTGEMTATAFDHAGAPIASTNIPPGEDGTVILPGARAGKVYRLVVEGPDTNAPRMLVLADSDMVQRAGPGNVAFFDLAGQYFVGTRIFTRATEDTVTFNNPVGRCLSVRDAETGEVLYHQQLVDLSKHVSLDVGRGRLLQITMSGWTESRFFRGVSPYFARTREAWFDPEEASDGAVPAEKRRDHP